MYHTAREEKEQQYLEKISLQCLYIWCGVTQEYAKCTLG